MIVKDRELLNEDGSIPIQLLVKCIENNVGLISFPFPMRFAVWFMSILPNFISDFIYKRLPHKV